MKTYDRAGGPGLKGGTAEGIDKVLRLPLLCEDTPDMVELEKFEDLFDMVVLEMSGGTIPGPGVFVLLWVIEIKFMIIWQLSSDRTVLVPDSLVDVGHDVGDPLEVHLGLWSGAAGLRLLSVLMTHLVFANIYGATWSHQDWIFTEYENLVSEHVRAEENETRLSVDLHKP